MGWLIFSLELDTNNTIIILINAIFHITAHLFGESKYIYAGTLCMYRERKKYIINILTESATRITFIKQQPELCF